MAQPRDPSPADLKRAKELATQGNEFYDEGRYLQAIVAYREAYSLSRAPGFLYNIAQAYRLGGDCSQAFSHYQRYLDADPDSNRAERVQQRINELRECAQAHKKRVNTGSGPATDTRPAPPGNGSTSPEIEPGAPPGSGGSEPIVIDTDAGRGKRWAGLAAATAGAAAVATGAYFGVRARSLSDEVSRFSNDMPGSWNAALDDKQRQGQAAETTAIVLLAAGSAAILTGATLYLLGMRDKGSEHTRSAWVAPTSHGASIGWSWHF